MGGHWAWQIKRYYLICGPCGASQLALRCEEKFSFSTCKVRSTTCTNLKEQTLGDKSSIVDQTTPSAALLEIHYIQCCRGSGLVHETSDKTWSLYLLPILYRQAIYSWLNIEREHRRWMCLAKKLSTSLTAVSDSDESVLSFIGAVAETTPFLSWREPTAVHPVHRELVRERGR